MTKNALISSTMVGETFEIYFQNDQKFFNFIHHGWRKFWNLFVLNNQKCLNFIHHGWRNIWNLVVSNNQKVFNSVQHDFVETYLSQMTKHGIYHFMQDIKQLLSNMLQVDGQTTSFGEFLEKCPPPKVAERRTLYIGQTDWGTYLSGVSL